MEMTRIRMNPVERFVAALERSLLVWNQPVAAMILAGIIFTGLSWTAGSPWRLSTAPYYNLLADALLHGQLHLRLIPENTIDLSVFEGRYYLYWGPLPALLAVPWVALFGPGFSDVLQTLFFSALNVGLLALVFKAAVDRGVVQLTPAQRALLVLFFALGTAYAPITGSGHVWQMAQVQSILCMFLAYLAALKLENGKAFFFTGLAMSGVLLTRMSAVFVAIFLAWYLLHRHWRTGARKLLGYCVLGVLPVLVTFLLIGLYNYARFGDFLDNGLAYHLMNPYFAHDYATYGLLNLHFLPENFYYTYLFYPYTFFPFGVTVRCGSLFLLSPLFFYALYGLWKHRRELAPWMLFLSILLGNIPVLLLMGPGSSLFGPRYTLDFILPLLLLTAFGMQRASLRLPALLVVISIFHYLLGTLIYLQGVP